MHFAYEIYVPWPAGENFENNSKLSLWPTLQHLRCKANEAHVKCLSKISGTPRNYRQRASWHVVRFKQGPRVVLAVYMLSQKNMITPDHDGSSVVVLFVWMFGIMTDSSGQSSTDTLWTYVVLQISADYLFLYFCTRVTLQTYANNIKYSKKCMMYYYRLRFLMMPGEIFSYPTVYKVTKICPNFADCNI